VGVGVWLAGAGGAWAAGPYDANQIKVVSDRWPDCAGLKEFGESCGRIMGAASHEEKALAVFRFIQQMTFYSQGMPKEPVYTGYLMDPLKVLNVHTDHHCEGLSRMMEMTWRSLGYRAEKWYQQTHTRAEVYYPDGDGVGRWHLFDVSVGWYARDRSGARLAGAEELILDNSLMYLPNGTPVMYRALPVYPGYTHERHLPLAGYVPRLNLRRHESVKLLWGNIGAPYRVPTDRAGGQYDFEHGPYEKTYGNGTWQYRPDFQAEACGQGAESVAGLKSRSEDGRDPNLHATAANAAGELVYHFQLPYIISDAWFDGTIVRTRTGDRVRMLISNNGTTWREMWSASGLGRTSVWHVPLSEPFDVDEYPYSGLITPFGHYDYYLKIEVLAAQDTAEAGIEGLTITTVTQHNLFSLPQLWPVHNEITVSGGVAPTASLVLTYEWEDAQGVRQNQAVVESPPYTYEILADGTSWEEVVSRSLTIEATARQGGGNRVTVKESAPGATADVRPEDAFPTTRILGTDPAPELKTTAEYVQDIEDGLAWGWYYSKVNPALLGLQARGDPAAAAAIRSAIYHPYSWDYYTKAWALQALWLSVGAGAAPDMLAVVNHDPNIGYTDVTGRRTEEGLWAVSASLASCALGHIRNAEARQGADRVAELVGEWKGIEIQWGLIRDLGLLGDSGHVPVLAGQIDGTESSYNAVWGLGEIGGAGGVGPILDFLTGEDGYVFEPGQSSRHAVLCVEALGRLGDEHLSPRLWRYLEHWDEDLRGAAAEALGRLGEPNAVAPLEEMLEVETFEWVKEAARRSVLGLGPDLTKDGVVNLADVALQGQYWQVEGVKVPGDVNRDGVVGVADLAAVIGSWLSRAGGGP